MQKQKGFIGLIAILIVAVIGVVWMVYLLQHNWFGAGIANLSGGLPGANKNSQDQSKDINGQLDSLRQNLKTVQNQKDQEIQNAMNSK
jgi:flagellar basal body-associated protein FliL